MDERPAPAEALDPPDVRAASDEAFADAFEQISVGSLDVATRADTDSTNTPMVAAFERLGYRRFALRVVAS